jgi:hypothetical protein
MPLASTVAAPTRAKKILEGTRTQATVSLFNIGMPGIAEMVR